MTRTSQRTVVVAVLAIVPSLAACRAGASLRPPSQPQPTDTATALAMPAGTPSPAEVLRRTHLAMRALRSYEAHATFFRWNRDGEEGYPPQLWQTDYRYEPPDRHSFTGWYPGLSLDGTPQPEDQPGETIRIGPHYWQRTSLQPDAAWTCTRYDVSPPDTDATPPDDADYVGFEQTTFGARHHFRHVNHWPDGAVSLTDYWIDAATWHVVRIDSTLTSGSHTELDLRQLDAFDSPTQIVPPGPCVLPTATATEEP